jgi:hypothetical protein
MTIPSTSKTMKTGGSTHHDRQTPFSLFRHVFSKAAGLVVGWQHLILHDSSFFSPVSTIIVYRFSHGDL